MSLRLLKPLRLILPMLLAAGLFSGCFSSKNSKNISRGTIEALPPAFLTGPAAALLTNAGGFRAHVVVSNDLRMAKPVSGELFVRDGKLLFAAEPEKKNAGGAFLFVSDLSNRQGFVWSEALQGYAPLTLNVWPTNLVNQQNASGLQRFEGHVCQSAEAVVQMSDGSQARFQLMRALDLNRIPIHISSISNASGFSLTFSKIQPAAPPADVFTPPTDFTKYNSPEMMVTELIMRQHNLRRRPGSTSEPVYDRSQK